MYHSNEPHRLFISATGILAPSRLIISARLGPFFTAFRSAGGVNILLSLQVLLQVAILHQPLKVRFERLTKLHLVSTLFVVVAEFIGVPVRRVAGHGLRPAEVWLIFDVIKDLPDWLIEDRINNILVPSLSTGAWSRGYCRGEPLPVIIWGIIAGLPPVSPLGRASGRAPVPMGWSLFCPEMLF